MSERNPRFGARRSTTKRRSPRTGSSRTPGRARRFALGLLVVMLGWGFGNAPVHTCSGLGLETFFCSCDHNSPEEASPATDRCCTPVAPKSAPEGDADSSQPLEKCCKSGAPVIVDGAPPVQTLELDDLPPPAWVTGVETALPRAGRASPRLRDRGPGDRSPPTPAYILFQRFLS